MANRLAKTIRTAPTQSEAQQFNRRMGGFIQIPDDNAPGIQEYTKACKAAAQIADVTKRHAAYAAAADVLNATTAAK